MMYVSAVHSESNEMVFDEKKETKIINWKWWKQYNYEEYETGTQNFNTMPFQYLPIEINADRGGYCAHLWNKWQRNEFIEDLEQRLIGKNDNTATDMTCERSKPKFQTEKNARWVYLKIRFVIFILEQCKHSAWHLKYIAEGTSRRRIHFISYLFWVEMKWKKNRCEVKWKKFRICNSWQTETSVVFVPLEMVKLCEVGFSIFAFLFREKRDPKSDRDNGKSTSLIANWIKAARTYTHKTWLCYCIVFVQWLRVNEYVFICLRDNFFTLCQFMLANTSRSIYYVNRTIRFLLFCIVML